jgi:ABC-2 type transport system ATP-binding protein
VDGLDLAVHQGEFFGLLGTNGAGKSTTIGMLTTLVAPSAGKAWAAGYEVSADPVGVKSRIGVISQANALDRALTVADNLAFRGRYFALPAPTALTPATGHMPTWAYLTALSTESAAEFDLGVR